MKQEELKEKFEKQYEQGQEIYVKRKTLAEHPFAYIKHNPGKRNFLLRGKKAVQAEISLAATCFNVVRMITISGGTHKFIKAMATISWKVQGRHLQNARKRQRKQKKGTNNLT